MVIRPPFCFRKFVFSVTLTQFFFNEFTVFVCFVRRTQNTKDPKNYLLFLFSQSVSHFVFNLNELDKGAY